MANFIRQGDLLFVPVTETPAWLRLEERKPDPHGVIARGEATGHNHRVAVLEDAEVFPIGAPGREDVFVRVGPNGVSIVHEEHKSVTLAPSTLYKVHRAREYDYLSDATRRVRD